MHFPWVTAVPSFLHVEDGQTVEGDPQRSCLRKPLQLSLPSSSKNPRGLKIMTHTGTKELLFFLFCFVFSFFKPSLLTWANRVAGCSFHLDSSMLCH